MKAATCCAEAEAKRRLQCRLYRENNSEGSDELDDQSLNQFTLHVSRARPVFSLSHTATNCCNAI